MDETKCAGRMTRAVWAACLTLIVGSAGRADAGAYTGLVVFGDSLSDVGNTYAAAGVPSAADHYYEGRYSDGPNWVDHLAAKLGVAAPTPSILGGANYAWGFAQSGDGFSYPLGAGGPGVPNLLTQVGGFLLGGGTLAPTELVSVWAGANDFLNNGATDYVQVADNVVAAVSALAAAGGTHFLVGNLPLLGVLPATLGLPEAVRDQLNLLTLAFNATLEAKLAGLQASFPGIEVYFNDVNAEFQMILGDPAAYGLTDVTGGAVLGGLDDGAGYLFWDSVHPTTEVHRLIADRAYAAAVPEPSSIALAAIGAGALVAAARSAARRRAA